MMDAPLRVLTYHRVVDPLEAASFHRGAVSATPEVFRRQMRHLARRYRVVTAEDVLEAFSGRKPLPRRAVLITFDDAYADFGEIAWPILRRYGLPATLFVPTAYPDRPERRFWWDRISYAVRATERGSITVRGLGTLPLQTAEERQDSLSTLLGHIKAAPGAEARSLVELLVEDLCVEVPTYGDPRVLTWGELRSLAADGVSVGAHSRNHPALTRITEAEAREEIRGSRDDLERELDGAAVPIFAFPYGDHDDRVVEWVRDAGFRLAFTCVEGSDRLSETDPMRIRRTGISRRTTSTIFRLRLQRWFTPVDDWRRRRKSRGWAPAAGAPVGKRPRATPAPRSPEPAPGRPRGRSARPFPAATVEVHDRVDRIETEWDELADRVEAVPWLRPGWIIPWARTFGRGEMAVLALRRSGRLEALVPFQRRGRTLRSPSNYHTPAFDFLAVDQDAADRLSRELLDRSPRQISLSFLPGQGIARASLTRAARDSGHRIVQRVLERMPFLPLEEGWAEYEKRLSAKMLRELRRRRRRLEEEAPLELSVVDGTEELDPPLREMFRVEAAGWKGRRGTAIGMHSATREFYTGVARWSADRGWLRLAHLRLGGRSIATDFAVETDGVHYLLKTGYDEAYRRYGPGMMIRHEMLRRAFELPLLRYEFLGHDTAWKLQWAPALTEQYLFQLFRRSPLGSVEYAAFAYGRPVAKRLVEAARR